VSTKHRNRNGKQQSLPVPNTAIATVTQQSVTFSGPLPHPALLAKYNEVIPDGAERIMKMAERQSAHRESLEAQVVAGNIASQARGSIFAFILCLVAIIGWFALLFTGRNTVGLASIISSLAALASAFIYGKYQQSKERVEKAEALAARKRN
jgi:uncharacterized membrane protein